SPISPYRFSSSERLTRSACVGVHLLRVLASHSSATAWNELAAACFVCSFSALRSAFGSFLSRNKRFASSRRLRASASLTAGYTPSACTFSLPANLYLSRQ